MRYMKPYNLFRELLKSKALVSNELLKSNANAGASSRFLALDVGDKYVGLSVSDTTNEVASPLAVLVRKKTNIDLMAKDLQTLVSELSLGGFVFGCPLDRLKTSRDALQVKLLVDELCRTGELSGVKYTFWDESFTSKNVEMYIKCLKMHPTMEKTTLDKFAAVEILQGYLDFVNKKRRLQLFDTKAAIFDEDSS